MNLEKTLCDAVAEIKLLCILNFVELQEIRRRLDIAEPTENPEIYEYFNNADEYLRQLDNKLRFFRNQYPHLDGILPMPAPPAD